MKRAMTIALNVVAIVGSMVLAVVAYSARAGTLVPSGCPACGALTTLALIALIMSAVLAWPAYSFIFSRVRHQRAAALPWAMVALHAYALFAGPAALLGTEMPYVPLKLAHVPQGPWSQLSSETSSRDDGLALGTEALGRATAALGASLDSILGRPSLGAAIQFRKTAELILVRKTFDLLRGEDANAACSAIGISDVRFCETAAINNLLMTCPLMSAWALGTLFTELEKRALPDNSPNAALAADLAAAQHRNTFVTMTRIAKILRAAPVPTNWPEAAFIAQRNSRSTLFWDLASNELQSRRYWLRSMAERLENIRKVLRAEAQRMPANAAENDAWLEAQATVDGLKSDATSYSTELQNAGRMKRLWLRLRNPAASLPFAIPQ